MPTCIGKYGSDYEASKVSGFMTGIPFEWSRLTPARMASLFGRINYLHAALITDDRGYVKTQGSMAVHYRNPWSLAWAMDSRYGIEALYHKTLAKLGISRASLSGGKYVRMEVTPYEPHIRSMCMDKRIDEAGRLTNYYARGASENNRKFVGLEDNGGAPRCSSKADMNHMIGAYEEWHGPMEYIRANIENRQRHRAGWTFNQAEFNTRMRREFEFFQAYKEEFMNHTETVMGRCNELRRARMSRRFPGDTFAERGPVCLAQDHWSGLSGT